MPSYDDTLYPEIDEDADQWNNLYAPNAFYYNSVRCTPMLEHRYIPTMPTPELGVSVYKGGDVTTLSTNPNTTTNNKPTNISTLNYNNPFYPAQEPKLPSTMPPSDKPTFQAYCYHGTCHLARVTCPHADQPPRHEAKLSIDQLLSTTVG